MKPTATLFTLLMSVTLLSAAPLTAVRADATSDRIGNVERLVEKSSGARQVTASGNAEAAAAQQEARDLIEQARQRAAAGDTAGAGELLDRATASMFSAVRMSGVGPAVAEKHVRDYDDRAASIAALMEALQRIAVEKGETAKSDDIKRVVARLLAEAEKLKTAGDYKGGRRTLDAAYDVAKRSIDELRSGDTLVRSLDFATKEEEYRYEVDRNDTHQMLIKVLLEEKRGDPAKDKLIDGFIDKARQLRTRAEDEAGRGEYEAAVGTLEASTKELVRAIRSAGVYIPG